MKAYTQNKLILATVFGFWQNLYNLYKLILNMCKEITSIAGK